MLKKYYAKGNSVVLSGKHYPDGKLLPKRKAGAYDCLVDNNMATVEEEKIIIKASADNEVAEFQAVSEDWVDKPTEEYKPVVKIETKVSTRGKK